MWYHYHARQNDDDWQYEMDISLLDGKLKGIGRKGKDGVICISLQGEFNTSPIIWAEVNERFDLSQYEKYAGVNCVECSSRFARSMFCKS